MVSRQSKAQLLAAAQLGDEGEQAGICAGPQTEPVVQ